MRRRSTTWTSQTPARPRGLLTLALLVFTLGGMAFGVALLQVIRLDPLPVARATPATANDVPTAIWLASTPESRLAAAAADPFDPDRIDDSLESTGADEEVLEDVGDSVSTPAPAAGLRLLGTIVAPDGTGAIAVCQLGAGTPVSVRLGEQIDGYRLQRVEPGRATFVSPDGEPLTLLVPKPGSSP